jgi:uncharacterized protein DUF5658
MRRIVLTTVMGLMLTASSVLAADEEGAKSLAPTIAAAATSIAQKTDLAAVKAAQFKAPRRPMLLPTLYAGSALLQGYDAYSTLSALKSGATEANPLMKGITKSPVAFIALKAGMTTVSIMAAERMWKDNHRVRAIVVMAISNGMMAMVAKHNAGVLNRVR